MSSPFSRSPSGDTFEGNNPGSATAGVSVVPVWNASLREWEPATLPSGGGGAILPLSTVLYCDAGTLSPPGDQDGSIANPFSSVQTALDSVPGGVTLIIVPGDYPSLVIPADGRTVHVVNASDYSAPTIIESVDVGDTSTLVLQNMQVGAISLGAGSALKAILGFTVASITGGDVVELYGSFPGRNGGTGNVGAITTGALAAIGTLFTDAIATTGDMNLCQCQTAASINVGGDLYIDLQTLTALRTSSIVPTVTGAQNIIDAPTAEIVCNVDSVAGAPKIEQRVIALPGCKSGDTFAAAIRSPSGPITGLAIGEPYCLVDDQVIVPIIMAADAAPVSMDLVVTRFTTGGTTHG